MPPPGYRSAASRSTPTQPLVVESPAPISNTWVSGQQSIGSTVSADTDASSTSASAAVAAAADVSALTVEDGASQPVRRRLLADENSPPDGPTDDPEGAAAATASSSPIQKIGATDEDGDIPLSPQDAEEARIDAELAEVRPLPALSTVPCRRLLAGARRF